MKNEKRYTRLITPTPGWEDSRYVNRRTFRLSRWAMRALTTALTIASIANIASVWDGGSPEQVLSCFTLAAAAIASAMITP